MALEVKLKEEKKALLFLSSLPSSYVHLETTIMIGKETLELEDVRQMLQNKLMNKTDSTNEARDWLSRARGEHQKIRDPKEIQRLLTILLATIARNQDTSRKNV